MVAFDKPKTHIASLSYSSVSTYCDCGERWRLSRVFGLDKSTYWVALMGSAVHFVTEQYDRAEAGLATVIDSPCADDFQTAFVREVEKAEHFEQEILASGRELKSLGLTGGPNKKDRAWCEHFGPLFVQSWIDWRRQHNFRMAFLPDGTPGIECELTASLGGYPFKGYADRVFLTPSGEIVVVDVKTGNTPGSSAQLQAYAALLRSAGLNVSRGGFWMASKGDVAEWVDTPADGDAQVHYLAGVAGGGIEAGVFIPHLSPLCKGCGVRDYCSAVGGKDAGLVPAPSPVAVGLPPVDELTGEVV